MENESNKILLTFAEFYAQSESKRRVYRVVSRFSSQFVERADDFQTDAHAYTEPTGRKMLAHAKWTNPFCQHIISVTYLFIFVCMAYRCKMYMDICIYNVYINFKVQCSY